MNVYRVQCAIHAYSEWVVIFTVNPSKDKDPKKEAWLVSAIFMKNVIKQNSIQWMHYSLSLWHWMPNRQMKYFITLETK